MLSFLLMHRRNIFKMLECNQLRKWLRNEVPKPEKLMATVAKPLGIRPHVHVWQYQSDLSRIRSLLDMRGYRVIRYPKIPHELIERPESIRRRVCGVNRGRRPTLLTELAQPDMRPTY